MSHQALLGKHPMFDELSPTDLEALAARLAERNFAPGETVFSAGERGAAIYIVLTGQVEIFLPPQKPGGEAVLLKDLGPGQVFGELSLFDDKPRSASVKALTASTLLVLTREDLIEHLGRSKAAAVVLLGELAERLRETNALLSQRAAANVVKEIEQSLTFGQRLADKVAELNGSWAFISAIIGLTVFWSVANRLLPKPFDDYPYVFFNLVLAIVVTLQGPLIVMSQNRQSLKERAQAENDYRVNLKNELNIERLLADVAAFREDAQRRFDALERGGQRPPVPPEQRPPATSAQTENA